MIGQLLDGRYQVLRVLGTGGFGQTFIAQDTRRPGSPICVVKHLKPASNDTKFLKIAQRLFQSEAETLEKLGDHDQIPRLLAYFEENREFYLVQEFIEGHPLTEELPSGYRWTEGQVVALLRDVLGVLAFLHSKGAIHRDIKPDNIIRRHSDNKFVLVDFGAVKQIRTPIAAAPGHTSLTIAVGTPGYMPSEQGQGKPRPSSDIYALGVVGIQALTGLQPSQLDDDPETGDLLWKPYAQVSPELAAILSKMVKCYFRERYVSAADALKALQPLKDYHLPARPVRVPASAPASLPVDSSAYVSTLLTPQNRYASSGSAALPERFVKPRDSVKQPLTQGQILEPTMLQTSLTVLSKALSKTLPIAGWGTIAAILSLAVLVWSKRVHPPLASRLSIAPSAPSPAAKPSPPVSQPVVMDNPLPISPSPIDILSPPDTKPPVVNPSPDSPFPDVQLSPGTSPFPAINPSLLGKPSSTNPSVAVNVSSPSNPAPATSSQDSGAATLVTAQQQAQSGKLLDAIATAQTVPSDSAAYHKAQDAIAQWQNKLSSPSCPSAYTSVSGTSASNVQTGRISFTNGTNETVSVKLYDPSAPDQPSNTWNVAPGEKQLLGDSSYSSNWGIQVNCSSVHMIGDVSNLSQADGTPVFQTSSDNIQ
jgi:serine/threonine-protein kinase